MALEIIWSEQAAKGYSKILHFIDKNWSANEVRNFENEMKAFFKTLSKHPYILKESSKKGLRRGPINKLTLLTYSIDENKNQIQLINIRSTRQNPKE